jgi:hypothetical protein
MQSVLTEAEREHFRKEGWVKVSGLLDCTVAELQHAVDEVAALPEGGEWLHHFELTDFGPALARTENFIPFSPVLKKALVDGKIRTAAGELLGEEALLYKEKINYKLVGGAGFAPHQDKPAYPFVNKVLSVMVAVDDATVENGCLQVVDRLHQQVLPQDDRGCILGELADTLAFHPMPLAAGDTLFFDALTPHKSAVNTSLRARRALYPTYNAASEGDLRTAYYQEKLQQFATPAADGVVRLSLIQDFEGRPL